MKLFGKLLLAASIFNLALASLNAQEAKEITLKEVIEYTIATHPRVESFKATVNTSQYIIQERKGAFLPTLDYSYSGGPSNTRSPSLNFRNIKYEQRGISDNQITLNQLLCDGGEASALISMAKTQLKGNTFRLSSVTEEVALRTMQIYLNVLWNKALMDVAEKNLEKHQELNRIVAHRVTLKKDNAAARYQMEARVILVEAAHKKAEIFHKESLRTFKQYTDMDAKGLTSVNITNLDIPQNVKDAIQLALLEHPRLREAEESVRRASFDIKRAKAAFYPKIHLQLQGRQGEDFGGLPGEHQDASAKLIFSFNIFNGQRDKATLSSTHSFERERREEKKSLAKDIAIEVEGNWARLQSASKDVTAFTKHQQLIRKTADAYLDQYSVSKRSLLDLLSIESEYFNSSRALVSAQYTQLIQAGRMATSIGSLTKRLK